MPAGSAAGRHASSTRWAIRCSMEEFGGGFIYAMPDGVLSVGFVGGLDYQRSDVRSARRVPALQAASVRRVAARGGQMVRYGAKALPEGGWHTIPRVYADGVLIAGDAGGFLNSMRLKGIHLAMRTGMLAAETAFDAVRSGRRVGGALEALRGRDRRERGAARAVSGAQRASELRLRPAGGPGVLRAVAGDRRLVVRDPMPAHAGYERMQKLADYYRDGAARSRRARSNPAKIDRQLTFDRLTNVHYSGTRHAEDQPSHLIVHDADVCRTRCREEYGNPCTRFCPANVYEMVDAGDGTKRLQINASNCVHCKTCDIMDPYQIIDWVPPEGRRRAAVRRHVSDGSDRSGDSSAAASASKASGHRRGRLLRSSRARPHADAGGSRATHHYDAIVAIGPASRSWRSGTAASSPASTTSAIAASSSSPARTSTASGSRGIIERFGYGTARGSTSRGGARALVQMRRDWPRAGRSGSRSTARAGRRASRSPARSGWPARPAIRSCRFTSKRDASGRRRAGIARRSRSRSPRSRVAIGEPMVGRRMPTDATIEDEASASSSETLATLEAPRAGAAV